MPRTVVDWLRTHPERRAQAVEGSLVSADISGFTRLSERLAALGRAGAEELNELVDDCFDRMIEACESHGGDVLKFGAPTPYWSSSPARPPGAGLPRRRRR